MEKKLSTGGAVFKSFELAMASSKSWKTAFRFSNVDLDLLAQMKLKIIRVSSSVP